MTNDMLRIALLQMKVEVGMPEVNFAKAKSMLEEAAQAPEKPDVILLPEMWNTGYALDRIHNVADSHGERTKSMIADFCSKYGINVIAGSIAEKQDDQIKNTIFAFDRQGNMISDYSKIHLFQLMDEHNHLTAGDKLGAFELDGHPCGMMICYDIRFPELARKLALDGAQMLFIPAEWPHPRLHHWRTLLTARAIENQMFVVSCNNVGTNGATVFFGNSMIIDPWGEVVAEAGDDETIIYATIDLGVTEQVRGTIPVFADRRPSLY